MNSGSPDSTWQDEDLVRECLAGNQAAWTALVDKYARLVYSIPGKYRLPAGDVSDIFQQVWTDLYRDLPRLESAGSLRSWLITATARRCLLQKKRLQRVSHVAPDQEHPDERPTPAQLHHEARREQLVREALVGLSPRCRRMIEMLFFEHPPRPYADVARELGLAGGSIGFIRGRCLQKLRKLLGEEV